MPSTTSSRRPFRVGRSKTGFGLFATRTIERGTFLAYYRGRKLRTHEADEIANKYLFEINSRWTIDGSSRRNVARYINHSCRPNADVEIKGHEIVISARKDHPGGRRNHLQLRAQLFQCLHQGQGLPVHSLS
jgi:SET domain-containing protein